MASEQSRPDVAQQRDEWFRLRQPRMRIEPHRLLFIDETGTTTKMTRLRGRCSANVSGWMSPSAKGPRVTQIIQDCGAWPLFLPPYSPDLSPIEMAFAKLKERLRKQGARTIEAVWQAIGNICHLFKPTECWNFFRHAGYATDFT